MTKEKMDREKLKEMKGWYNINHDCLNQYRNVQQTTTITIQHKNGTKEIVIDGKFKIIISGEEQKL